MRVLALRSPTIINDLSTAISPALPIGLAYVLGAIRDLVEIEVIDPIAEKPETAKVVPFKNGTSILGLTPEEVVERVKKTPDVCLISSMFSMEWPMAKALIDLVREKFPKCLIIGGGEAFTALPEYVLENSALDICVLGEGEETLRELIERIQREGGVPLDVEGAVVKDPTTKEIVRNGRRTRIKKIEQIPYPAWEYFNVEGFLAKGISNTSSGKQDHRPFLIVASRGCPYECTFCSNPSMWGRYWNPRSTEDVVAEMKHWIDVYGVNHFDFCDLTAIVQKKWIVEFCEHLIEEDLPITWGLPSGTRSEALDAEVLALLSASGCNDLDYAPENGSEYILKIMKKKIKTDRMIASIAACHKTGINSKANIIFGYPQERLRDVAATYWFILRMAFAGLNDLLVTPLSIYPGSAIFEEITERRRIQIDEDYFLSLSSQGSLNVAPSYSEHYGAKSLFLLRIGAFSMFYVASLMFRPLRFVRLARDILTGTGSTRLSAGLINIVQRRGTRVEHRSAV